MILPKQWKHWCQDQHLKPAYPGRGRGKGLTLRGRGYYWRVNCNGDLQIGDLLKGWVLWSMNTLPIPKTRKEFRHAVNQLLATPASLLTHRYNLLTRAVHSKFYQNEALVTMTKTPPIRILSPEKGYYKGCKLIDQEVDGELYLHIEKRSNPKEYLVIRR